MSNKKIQLYTLLAEYLELDSDYVKDKIKPLKDDLIDIISRGDSLSIQGILNITPKRLPSGVFLNTTTKQFVKVPERIKAVPKIHARLNNSIKDKKLTNIKYF